jgi:hypothetical protein
MSSLLGQAPHVQAGERPSASEFNRFRDKVWNSQVSDTAGHMIFDLGTGMVLNMRRSVTNAVTTVNEGMENHAHRDSYDGGYSVWGFTGPT